MLVFTWREMQADIQTPEAPTGPSNRPRRRCVLANMTAGASEKTPKKTRKVPYRHYRLILQGNQKNS